MEPDDTDMEEINLPLFCTKNVWITKKTPLCE